ncbi:MAG: branched-chain amino acid transport system II carrier protein, partial [Bacteroidia bacterium]|nr:branched-chain amino acid transport system II carrier protein [Bacteroidia bacterium]
LIPLISLFGHAKLQGNMLDFGTKVSPVFSLVYCLIIYLIIITLPCPRTAAVTHEMAIAPFFNVHPLTTSTIYFLLAFLFVMNRTKVLGILGKYLTPILVAIVAAIIGIGLFWSPQTLNEVQRVLQPKQPLVDGLLEGYQTYDAIAGMVMGGVVVISMNAMGGSSYNKKRKIIARSGLIAMTGLFIIYAGLIALGAKYSNEFDTSITRIQLLQGLAQKTLGATGTLFINSLMGLACFTTAVAIIVSVADFFKTLFKNSQRAYVVAAIISCVLGILIGSFEVGVIIDVAVPALLLIYPISIVLILLTVLPERLATTLMFRAVVFVTLLCSLPEVLGAIFSAEWILRLMATLPLSAYSLGWVLPAFFTFFVILIYNSLNPRDEE